MAKNIKFNINDGIDFFAHETSIQFSPTQFILDFKSITPRVDPRNQDGSVYSLKHNVVMLDPYHAVRMVELMQKVINQYEKEFGKILIPKQIQKIEKRQSNSKNKKKIEQTKTVAPTYLG